MIRVSLGPIKISKWTDDRWARPVRYWSVNHWGYVGLEQFHKLVYFESQPNTDHFLVVKSLQEQLEDRMKALGATQVVHQFNAIKSLVGPEYIRMCAILNNSDKIVRIQFIPWFDAWVKYPVYCLVCKIANKFITSSDFN